jgi:hypothetical protein
MDDPLICSNETCREECEGECRCLNCHSPLCPECFSRSSYCEVCATDDDESEEF